MSSDPPLGITVAVCTYRRPELLAGTLRSLVRQDYPTGYFEIIVIDNNSPEDDTRQVVHAFKDAPIAPRYLRETRQGLSHARNRAVGESRREIVVFADDDISTDHEWLGKLVAPFRGPGGQQIAAIGGEVVPVYPEGVEVAVLIHQPLRLRATAGPLRAGQIPMGANLAFRRAALIEAGLFDPRAGRHGSRLFGGDENRLIERLARRRHQIWFVPEARVFHHLPRERSGLRYALQHGFDSACSRVLTHTVALKERNASPAAYLVSRLGANLAKTIVCGLFGALWMTLGLPSIAAPQLVRAARALGYVQQTTRMLGAGPRRLWLLLARSTTPTGPANLPSDEKPEIRPRWEGSRTSSAIAPRTG